MPGNARVKRFALRAIPKARLIAYIRDAGCGKSVTGAPSGTLVAKFKVAVGSPLQATTFPRRVAAVHLANSRAFRSPERSARFFFPDGIAW